LLVKGEIQEKPDHDLKVFVINSRLEMANIPAADMPCYAKP
jgi:hypothetical protein